MGSYLNSQSVNIGMVYLLTYAAGAAWFPLFTLFLEKEGLSSTQSGLVVTILFVAMFVALPFWGFGADKWGRKKTLMISIIISSISLIGFLLGNTFVFFASWMAFFAIVFNPVPPLIDSLALDYIEGQKKISYGHLRMLGSLGWLIAAPIVGYFIENNELKLIFPIAAVLYFLNIVFVYRIKSVQSNVTGLELNLRNLGPVLKNGELIRFLIIILFVAITSFCIQTFLGVYLDDMNASTSLIGWAFSFEGMSEIPFYFISAWLIKKFGLRKVFLFTMTVTALRMYLYSIIHDPKFVLFVEFTHGISFALFFVTMVETMNRLVPSEWRATGQSLMWASYNGLGALLGNAIAGFLIDKFSVHNMFFYNAVALAIISILTYFFFVRSKPKQV